MAKRNRKSPEERFWEMVDRNGPVPEYAPHLGRCWLWLGSLTLGYGSFRRQRAHRFSYELLVGPIPDGLVVDHLCRNKACVNPSHLEPVTQTENVRRGIAYHKSYCVNGHEMTPGNTLTKKRVSRQIPGPICRECARASRERWRRNRGIAARVRSSE